MTRKEKKDGQGRQKNDDQIGNPRTVNPTRFQEEDIHVRSDEIGHGTIGRWGGNGVRGVLSWLGGLGGAFSKIFA